MKAATLSASDGWPLTWHPSAGSCATTLLLLQILRSSCIDLHGVDLEFSPAPGGCHHHHLGSSQLNCQNFMGLISIPHREQAWIGAQPHRNAAYGRAQPRSAGSLWTSMSTPQGQLGRHRSSATVSASIGMPDSTSTRMSAGQSATHRRTSIIDCAANRMNGLINSRLRSFQRPPMPQLFKPIE